MAETEGKLLTCDLCGATVLLKYVNDGIRKHEDPPEGWGYWHVQTEKLRNHPLSKKYKKIPKTFLFSVSGVFNLCVLDRICLF